MNAAQESPNIVKNGKVLVNLIPLGLALCQDCSAVFWLDTFGRPKEVQIFLEGLPPSQINELLNEQFQLPKIFGNPKIEGQLADETKFEAQIGFVKGIRFDCSGTLVFHCYLEKFQLKTSGTWSDCEKWVFQLANLKLDRGDIGTNYSAPLNGSRLNRISFKFANRNWNLDDDLFGQWPNRLDKIGQGPILSGALSTAFNEGDTDEQLQLCATDITELLSFALSRDVKWVSCSCQKKNGELFSMQHHYPVISPFNHHWFPVVDNFEFGNLKEFLEKGLQEIQSDRNWWSVTIGLLTQARISKYNEVKCSLFNTLLERISDNVNAGSNQAEIDPMLEKIINKDFEDKLHTLMIGVYGPWTIERTKSLCGTIKLWKKQPSIPNKIICACEKLKINKPFRKTLGLRHKLLHTGEFDSKLNDTEKLDYLFTLDAVASLLLIRIIGFDGYIYLQQYGNNHLLVGDVLNTTATQESNEVE